MKKAFFVECGKYYWVDVAKNLRRRGYEPVYWVAAPYMEGPVRQAFPFILFHSTVDAYHGIFPYDNPFTRLRPLGEEFIEKFSDAEFIAIKMMDRMDDGDTFLYNERLEHYYNLIKYYRELIEYYSPDVMVFSIAPHAVFNYVLYKLAKFYGIKTVMFEKAPVGGYIFPLLSFEEGSDGLKDAYEKFAGREEVSLGGDFSAYYEKLRGDNYDEAQPANMKIHRKNLKRKKGLFEDIFDKLKNPVPIPYMYLKEKGVSVEDIRMNKVKYLWYYYKNLLRKKRLKEYYDFFVTSADFSKPYIFVPLQYQPERSTSPLGGRFVNQELMIELLSYMIPGGWFLYVKEHNLQHWPVKTAERGRNTDFYKKIAKLPNVMFVSTDITSFKLIDNAKAVATVTGTTGWEAIVRGKPALVFGNPYYKICDGAIPVKSFEDCASAIGKIKDGYTPNERKVKAFLKAIETVSVRGYESGMFKGAAGITEKENAANITSAIFALIKSCLS